MKKKVIVGLSGGVDSAVCAWLLKEQGYQVEGMFMRNWDSTINNDVLGNPHDPKEVCPQEQDYLDALAVAKHLDIPLHRVDFVEEYWEKVFQYFLNEYQKNRTPNPDILCNKEIKFASFINTALSRGCDYIAMGHYARVLHQDNRHYLLRGLDSNKDQSYFLCQLTEKQIAQVLFPVGNLEKSVVRKIARDNNLPVASKKDSTGICFIGERQFKPFLKNYLQEKKGLMKTLDGQIIGNHDGIMYYTIGQRHGLGIGGAGEAWFVLGKDSQTNTLFVGQGENHPYLFSNRCLIENINWLVQPDNKTFSCHAKFRYRQADVEVLVTILDNGQAEVKYPNLSKAVTPGQAAVFYHRELVLGGGTIDKVYMDNDLRKY